MREAVAADWSPIRLRTPLYAQRADRALRKPTHNETDGSVARTHATSSVYVPTKVFIFFFYRELLEKVLVRILLSLKIFTNFPYGASFGNGAVEFPRLCYASKFESFF